jgi:hypothetical protein
MIPNAAPVSIDLTVNSAILASGGTNGLNFFCDSAIAIVLVYG